MDRVMIGYPELTLAPDGVEGHRVPSNYSLIESKNYGVGASRSKEEYLKFAKIDIEKRQCGGLKWCAEGTKQ